MILVAGFAFIAGLAILLCILSYWSQHRYAAIGNMLPAAVGTTLMVLGEQNALSGFLLAVINGDEADFMKEQKLQEMRPQAQQANELGRLSRAAKG